MIEDVEDALHAVGDVEIGLGLRAVAEHVQVLGVQSELLAEIENGAVRPAGADDVAEPADGPAQAEALAVGRDERLAGELARAVERDGQVPEVHLAAGVRDVAIDGAARGKDESRDAVDPCRLERVVCRDRALLEVEAGALEAPASLGVSREVKDDVVTAHGRGERVEVEGVGLDERGAAARQVGSEELPLADAHVVVRGDLPAFDEQIDEMAPHKAGSAHDEKSHDSRCATLARRRRATHGPSTACARRRRRSRGAGA